MDVTQTANDFVGYTSFNAPIVNERETQTTVNVKDGQTAVLGGIIENSINSTTNKIPVLGDLPLIGDLFRSTVSTHAKTELLIFLTPHVVRNPAEVQRLREETETDLDPKSLRGARELHKLPPTDPVRSIPSSDDPTSASPAQPAPNAGPSDSANAISGDVQSGANKPATGDGTGTTAVTPMSAATQ